MVEEECAIGGFGVKGGWELTVLVDVDGGVQEIDTM